MKLKLVIDSDSDDYRLFKTTISTVAQLRKTAVLRFTTDRLIVVSTPKTAASGAILSGDQGQLWCTIPRDIFTLYNVASIREQNAIAMECQCDSLVNVLRRYERCNHGPLTIKLQSTPEWNQVHTGIQQGEENKPMGNPICALSCAFTEHLGYEDSGKEVSHVFKVGVRLLYKSQDARIVEPMVNYTKLLMFQLPPVNGEYGSKFTSFVKRLDRYATLNHLMIYGDRNSDRSDEGRLRLLVQELDWKLDVQWRGPLEMIVQDDQPSAVPASEPGLVGNVRHLNAGTSMQIEDSEMDIEATDIGNVSTSRPSTSVSPQEQTSQVFIKAKDWKVCSKLYDSFEEVVLAISHDESCVLHCSLDRGTVDEHSTKSKERGQIIYYMARSKPL
ncbi:AGR289Cp [Eremothecium gossypii ATCC 10895]|uniref:DNA damage checkpoint control protein MEC3 n=1 Tax=Eremothecium gossypii (strain ATCC 10895 / CBS 109.51 / FGSC 9923 / NRRL Y-1056) TaxID=284811 RepID=MEC3_EREGS|nr:AGR289Cp [Eremothecium gossypii ATCC 10895]Q74ZB0.2 RecName: Full=DNA damage checkpoint control protein MEC3 [Eremothecium gossypii ATCC 10895]AAS54779.2 AGR289Cp [Eremothecium gossypii ATCC 10895]AEY99110.1 FAGR289Cp [Eremothecium gossypii FDAG1]